MKFINFEIHDSVGKIILNRPDVLNSFNRAMALELQEILDRCAVDSSARCILLTGMGRAFSAGQDLAEAVAPGVEIERIVREQYNPIINRIRKLEKPVVCAVNGIAAGAGANMAFCCDVIVAAKSATFIQSFSKIGLIPDSGGTFFLPRLIGVQRSIAWCMTGDRITAEQALQFGLVYKILPDESFMMEADELALRLATMPTRGLWLTKKLINASLENTLNQQLKLEEEIQAIAGQTYDYNEGVKAFLEKRKPLFKGI